MVDSFSLHKALLYAYRSNPNITIDMTNMFYSYFNSLGITKFEFNDVDLCFNVSGPSEYNIIMIRDIKDLFASFVVALFNNPEYNYCLNFEGNYKELKSLDSQLLYTYALNCITILNLSTDQNSYILKINLHN